MSEADFYELVKYVDDEPDISEERLQEFLDQGMWPDKPHEHVGFFQDRDNAEEQKELMEEGSETHTEEVEEGGWFAVIREREFMDK